MGGNILAIQYAFLGLFPQAQIYFLINQIITWLINCGAVSSLNFSTFAFDLWISVFVTHLILHCASPTRFLFETRCSKCYQIFKWSLTLKFDTCPFLRSPSTRRTSSITWTGTCRTRIWLFGLLFETISAVLTSSSSGSSTPPSPADSIRRQQR